MDLNKSGRVAHFISMGIPTQAINDRKSCSLQNMAENDSNCKIRLCVCWLDGSPMKGNRHKHLLHTLIICCFTQKNIEGVSGNLRILSSSPTATPTLFGLFHLQFIERIQQIQKWSPLG